MGIFQNKNMPKIKNLCPFTPTALVSYDITLFWNYNSVYQLFSKTVRSPYPHRTPYIDLSQKPIHFR